MPRWLWVWGPAVGMMAALFVSSSGEGPALPGRTDLLAHFSAYFVLGLLCIRACAGARWAGVSTAAAMAGWAMTAAYGLVDEFHQSFVSGRFAAADDWVADVAGGGAAVVAALAAARVLVRRGGSGRAV